MRTIPARGVATCVLLVIWIGHADGQSDWLARRQTQFAQWQAGHADIDAAIADLKAKTAALIAESKVRSRGPLPAAAPPVIYRVPSGILELWDNPVAPRMVVIPAGEYTMGAPPSEQNSGERDRASDRYANNGFRVARTL